MGNLFGNFDLSVTGGTDFHEFFNIFLLGSTEIVSGTTVVGDIKTNFFLKGINTEHASSIKDHEEGGHGEEDPTDNPQDGDDLDEEKVGITSIVEPANVVGVVTGSAHGTRFGEQTNGDDTPHTVGEVNWDGIDCVINLHHDEELGE